MNAMLPPTTQAAGAQSPAILSALRTLNLETKGLAALAAAVEGPLSQVMTDAVDAIIACEGRLVVTGMGKSGLIGRKITATLASTGTPAFYMHPAEASHGDLGMVTTRDVVLALSWSGETPELSDVVQYCRRFGICLIAITSKAESSLAKAANIAFILPRSEEACPHNLAPTTSTTMQLALGDAVAMALLEARGFSPADFRTFHPGGKLGSRLLTVADLMAKGEATPTVSEDATLLAAIMEISLKRLGATAVVDNQGAIIGAFTDGDLRRRLSTTDHSTPIREIMSTSPITVESHTLAAEALKVMNDNAISVIFVTAEERLVGAIHVQDLLRSGVA